MSRDIVSCDSNRGFLIRPKLKHWTPIVSTWFGLIDRYVCELWGDVPYAYSERANVGLLANAVWMAGGIALTEFCYKDESEGTRTSSRWGDLCVVHGGNTYIIEAKPDWHDEAGNLKKFRESLFRAKEQVEKQDVPNSKVYTGSVSRVAMVFCCPQVSDECDAAERSDQQRLNAIKEVWSKGGLDIVAWISPIPELENHTYPDWQKSWYPMMILTAKIVNDGNDTSE